MVAGGIVDIIADGRTGLLAAPDDPDDLARVLGRMLGDSELRVRLGEAGNDAARRQFSSSAIVERFLSWYKLDVASQGRS